MEKFVLDNCDTTQKWVVFFYYYGLGFSEGFVRGNFFNSENFFNSKNFFKRRKYTYLFFKLNLNEIENM